MAFNGNIIRKQRLELSKLLKDRCIDVALLSKTHLKPHERFFIYKYHLYRKDRFPNLKCGSVVAVRHVIPHANAHVDLPPLQSWKP